MRIQNGGAIWSQSWGIGMSSQKRNYLSKALGGQAGLMGQKGLGTCQAEGGQLVPRTLQGHHSLHSHLGF